MAYQINKTDGTVVATVADGQLDSLSTDLTLIGKNYSGFGESLNENFIRLLENFADSVRPVRPIRGQLWFDTSEFKLKVYSGTSFIPVSSATISNTRPITLGVGDLWFNDVDKQLYFFDGLSTILLGPAFSVNQGLSGFKVDTILDIINQERVVTSLYNRGQLLGIFSNEEFTPKTAIDGFTGNIGVGFTSSDLSGIKFDVTCSNSESLGGFPATAYVRSDTSNIINGQIRITSDSGLVVGQDSQASLVVNGGNVVISNSESGKILAVEVRRNVQQERAITVIPNTRTIRLYKEFLDSQVEIGGSLTIEGNLTVKGTTTTINTQNLTVDDKAIELARPSGTMPTDESADQGGIVLKGDLDKIILWSNSPTGTAYALGNDQLGNLVEMSLYSKAWNSSESFNLSQNRYYAIDGVPLIEQTSITEGAKTFRLTSAVTAIDGVSSFGKQNKITIGPGSISDPVFLKLQDNVISTERVNQDLILSPNGKGNIVLYGSPKITGLADPINAQDAATKEYVDKTVESKNIILSIDLSDNHSNEYIINYILNNIAPPSENKNGIQAKILCTIVSSIENSTTRIIKKFFLVNDEWQHQTDQVLPM